MRWASTLTLMVVAGAGPALSADVPRDIAAFVADRQQCDHFRGEEPYDEARRQEIAAALDRFCRGTDARLADLRKKYRKAPEKIRRMLSGFEHPIE
jgi:hypothetical protein